MVAERNAEAGYGQQRRRNREIKPIKTEVPQVPRHRGQGENKGADQERACDPVDAVGRNSESQGKGENCQINASGARISKLLKGATKNHVFFGPGMNAAAMRAVELLCFQLGRRPELFFYGPSGIGQLGR